MYLRPLPCWSEIVAVVAISAFAGGACSEKNNLFLNVVVASTSHFENGNANDAKS